jgi:hypothetical protein
MELDVLGWIYLAQDIDMVAFWKHINKSSDYNIGEFLD